MGISRGAIAREVLVVACAFVLALSALFVVRGATAPHYRLSEAAAIAAARADPETAHTLAGRTVTARAIPLDRDDRRVTFFEGPRVVLDVAVAPDGRVVSREVHPPGHPELGAPLANRIWMLALLTAVFLLAVAVVPLRRLRNLDALALAAFGGTVVLLNERLVAASVLLASPLLAYLAVRCLYVGLRGAHVAREQTPLYEWLTAGWDAQRRTRLLRIVTAATLLAFLAVTLTSTGASDVAAASLSGATQLLHGDVPYSHVPVAIHGDTYGLLAYLLYVPGALWTPVTDAWSDLSGALAVAAAGALATGLALARLGGLRALLAWLAFPPVLLAGSTGANDLVLAAFLAWTLVLALHARRSLLLLVAAAWIKVVPLILLPVWLARVGRRDGPRAVLPAVALSAALGTCLLVLGGASGAEEMVRGLVFQFQRGSFHAPWHTFGVPGLQPVVQAAVVASLAWAVARVARDPALRRDPVRLAALGGGLLLGLQLSANHWTWSYLVWAYPFVAVALLTPERRPQLVSRNTGHLPGTPLSSWSPRYSNSRPEPTTVP